MLAWGRGRWAFSQKPQFLLYLFSCKQLSSEGENIKTTTMRFFQLLLKVANHAALLAPTVRQTLDQQEKVGRRRRTLSGRWYDEYSRTSTNGHLSTTAFFFSFFFGAQSVYWLFLKPFYNGHLLLSPRCSLKRGSTVYEFHILEPRCEEIYANKVIEVEDSIACVAWRFGQAKVVESGRGQWNCEEIGTPPSFARAFAASPLGSAPDKTAVLRRLKIQFMQLRKESIKVANALSIFKTLNHLSGQFRIRRFRNERESRSS